MFTGIVEETGEIVSFQKKGRSSVLVVQCEKIREGLKVGHSVAVDGVCLTATVINARGVSFDLSSETMTKSTSGSYKRKVLVNLERAAKLGDRIGGHIVSGHTDATGKIIAKKISGSEIKLNLEIPKKISRYIVEKGSIAVDGISLTVAKCPPGKIEIAIIPHTLNATNLKFKKAGSLVNIECDQMGKYIEKFMRGKSRSFGGELF